MSDDRPHLPGDDLRDALGADHPERATVDQLHAELGASAPDAAAIEAHVHRLRLIPEARAIIVGWWDDPRTQRFIASLGATGL